MHIWAKENAREEHYTSAYCDEVLTNNKAYASYYNYVLKSKDIFITQRRIKRFYTVFIEKCPWSYRPKKAVKVYSEISASNSG